VSRALATRTTLRKEREAVLGSLRCEIGELQHENETARQTIAEERRKVAERQVQMAVLEAKLELLEQLHERERAADLEMRKHVEACLGGG
jgi:hypothetical protein